MKLYRIEINDGADYHQIVAKDMVDAVTDAKNRWRGIVTRVTEVGSVIVSNAVRLQIIKDLARHD